MNLNMIARLETSTLQPTAHEPDFWFDALPSIAVCLNLKPASGGRIFA
jgi:hypothetical protein